MKYYGFESHRLFTFENYVSFVEKSINQFPDNEFLVLVMHSWSFLNLDKTDVSSKLLEAFEQFVTTKSDLYEIISFDDLKESISLNKSIMEVPIDFAGYGNSDLVLKNK